MTLLYNDNGFGDSPAVAGLKVAGKGLLAVGLLLTPIFGTVAYVEHVEEEHLKETLVELDKQPSVTFGSLTQCQAEGHGAQACKTSRDNAMDVANSLGTAIRFDTPGECVQTYGKCGELIGAKGHHSYYPLVVAWQAERDNLAKAVPVYSSQEPGQGVRWDGKVVALP